MSDRQISKTTSIDTRQGTPRPGTAFSEIFVPKSVNRLFFQLIGALSLVVILQHGYGYSFVSALKELIANYDALLRSIFDPAELWLKPLLDRIGELLSIDVKLSWHWKYVFSLVGIYLASDVFTSFKRKRVSNTIFHALLGISVTFATGVIAGLIPIVERDYLSNLAAVAVPVGGLLTYSLLGRAYGAMFQRDTSYDKRLQALEAPTFWDAFAPRASRALARSAFGLAVAAIALLHPIVLGLPAPGLVLFAVLVVGLGIYWLAEAAVDVKFYREHEETWWSAYWRGSSVGVGVGMLNVFTSATYFFLFDIFYAFFVPR